MIEDSNMTQSTSDVSDSMINKTDGNESGNRSAPLKTKNQQELHATKGAVNSHDGTAITTANTSICSRSSNGKASESSSSVAIKPAAAASPIPPPPPPPIPASSSSSWSSSLSSLSPLAYLPTIPTPGFFKSGTQSQEEKGSAKGKEIVEGATDQQICQSKNEGLVSLFEEFWLVL